MNTHKHLFVSCTWFCQGVVSVVLVVSSDTEFGVVEEVYVGANPLTTHGSRRKPSPTPVSRQNRGCDCSPAPGWVRSRKLSSARLKKGPNLKHGSPFAALLLLLLHLASADNKLLFVLNDVYLYV